MEGGDSIPGAESLCWENVRVKVTLGEIVKGVKVKANTNFRLFQRTV